jgi:hypothetical protein
MKFKVREWEWLAKSSLINRNFCENDILKIQFKKPVIWWSSLCEQAFWIVRECERNYLTINHWKDYENSTQINNYNNFWRSYW